MASSVKRLKSPRPKWSGSFMRTPRPHYGIFSRKQLIVSRAKLQSNSGGFGKSSHRAMLSVRVHRRQSQSRHGDYSCIRYSNFACFSQSNTVLYLYLISVDVRRFDRSSEHFQLLRHLELRLGVVPLYLVLVLVARADLLLLRRCLKSRHSPLDIFRA
jgi:hypothetical protein